MRAVRPPRLPEVVDFSRVRPHIAQVNYDISKLLGRWEYEPGHILVRKFIGDDGTEKIQLRLDLGLLQMNAQGRPDGRRPHGHETLHHYLQARLRRYRKAHHGLDDGFQLSEDDCGDLQFEAMQYYHRALCRFQLEDFPSVLQDLKLNLKIFDFIGQYCPDEELLWAVDQFRPQVLVMRTRAEGALCLQKNDFATAINRIKAGIAEIRQLCGESSSSEERESDEVQSLQNWLAEIQAHRPLSQREKLELALGEAVKREDYEKAAQVRDALRNLKS